MIRYILLLTLFYSIVACKQTPLDCKHFKTGTFMYGGDTEVYRIVRTDSAQTETNLTTGEISKWGVHWLDDCSYEITFRERSTNRPTKRHKITIKIIDIEEEYATFEASADGKTFTTTKMQKVK